MHPLVLRSNVGASRWKKQEEDREVHLSKKNNNNNSRYRTPSVPVRGRVMDSGADFFRGDWLDISLEDALKKVVRNSKDPSFLNEPDPLTTDAGLLATTPVLFFSGFTNREMMATFQIISHEVHKETQGRLSVACAMAMPNAMTKRLRQVLLKVSGDHIEVLKPRSEKV
jgi:hypothetical protein